MCLTLQLYAWLENPTRLRGWQWRCQKQLSRNENQDHLDQDLQSVLVRYDNVYPLARMTTRPPTMKTPVLSEHQTGSRR
jgi:hypothetical protein